MNSVPRTAATNVVWLDEVDSTMSVASRLAERWLVSEVGELADTLLVAGRQNAGRGRGSHDWRSPRGGVYVTWLGWVESSRLGCVPLAAGLAAAEAVEAAVSGVRVRFKWPNDLIGGGGGKLGGILCQSRSVGGRHWVAVGFGINVAVAPVLSPPPSPPPAALLDEVPELDPEAVVASVVAEIPLRFRRALSEQESTCQEWASRSLHRVGDEVRLRDGTEIVTGLFLGFTGEGHLRLSVAGVERVFPAGELILPLEERGGEDGAAGS